jgi:hypothetical protein
LQTGGRKEAQSGEEAAADRVRCGEAYGMLRPPPSKFFKNTNLTRPGGEQGGAASQDKE